MKIKLENHQDGSVNVREYPFTVAQFIKIHFGAWGFYRIEKAAVNVYNVFCKFDGAHVYTVSKASATAPVKPETNPASREAKVAPRCCAFCPGLFD